VLIRASIAAVLAAAGVLVAAPARAETLRVCADPDNLPFSKSEGPERGLYVELAELVAKRLNASVEYTWWLTHNQRRALRNTIMQDACDAVFALPADADYKARGLQRTAPFIELAYAVVAPQGFTFSSLADLKPKRIAVQFMTPPHILLSSQEGFSMSSHRTADEVFDALAKGEADIAIVWGPVAGYENQRRFASRWQLTPVAGQGMGGPVAVAVKKGRDDLAAGIEKALAELKGDIAGLADKYGFPRGKPVDLEKRSQAEGAARFAVVPSRQVAWVNNPADGEAPQAGRTRFNDQCSHCHGKDGFSPVQERDLRRLKMRYDAKWEETAVATIKNGRQEKGMPPWKDALDDKQIQQVLGFLKTIQK
jgi:ABC-type amino acid transport substrate-binding protein/cytochrome c553